MSHNHAHMAEGLLKEHELRVTLSRVQTLQVFLDHTYALSQPDLEKSLAADCDRVTIYRTLTSFLDKGLIHKVLDDAGATKYALCQHSCDTLVHRDEHIHFKCNQCGNTHCLDDLPFPSFTAPKGYIFTETNVLIQGICLRCNTVKV